MYDLPLFFKYFCLDNSILTLLIKGSPMLYGLARPVLLINAEPSGITSLSISRFIHSTIFNRWSEFTVPVLPLPLPVLVGVRLAFLLAADFFLGAAFFLTTGFLPLLATFLTILLPGLEAIDRISTTFLSSDSGSTGLLLVSASLVSAVLFPL